MEGFVSNKEKLSFREIVLSHLKKILELSTNEFRGGWNKPILHGNRVDYEYISDTRKCYTQAVDSLSDVLLPHFDNAMQEKNEYLEEREDKIEKWYRDKWDEAIKKEITADVHLFYETR